jgi:hypothetical protein
MKDMIKLPAIVLGLLLLLSGTAQKVMAQGEDVSLQSFYDELSPYGTWIQDPQYGYVWRPDVEQSDFRPYYTNGRWAMTEYGNTWVSNYDWGWGPFHYGRWVYNRYNQWVWIPDTTWGPAWVSWRTGGGYYGWAPMGPGMNINVNFSIPDLWWVFIPQRNIYYDNFPRYYSRRNMTIIHNTTIINNTYVNNRRTYYTGPRADDIRRVTGRDVSVYNVNNSSRPTRSSISGNNVDIYRPRPSRGSSNTAAAPRNVIKGEGYASPRPERGTTGTGVTTGRPSRVPSTGNTTTPPRATRPNTTGTTPGNHAVRPERVNRGNANGAAATPSTRPERQPRTQQVQPQQTAPQQRPQRTEAPRQQQPQPPQRQAQPQRQEQPRQAPVQQARPERTQQSAPPARSNENRGSQSGGGRTESSRPSRGDRG